MQLHPIEAGCISFTSCTYLCISFLRCSKWAVSQSNAILVHDTSTMRMHTSLCTGLLDSALSHLALGAATKREFAAALARGLGANMEPGVREEFVSELSR